MVVDDSAVIRGFLTRYLQEDNDIEVVSSAGNGRMALQSLPNAKPEVVVLDIEMPEMDGLTALPKIIEAAPDTKVVMASTLTRQNAEISLRALEMGAADYVPKPESARAVNESFDFRRELVGKVKALATAGRKQRGEPLPGSVGQEPRQIFADGIDPSLTAQADGGTPISLRAPSKHRADLLAIGASTGGPQALLTLLKGLTSVDRVPILITQHMPPTFTAILAEHLSRATDVSAKEAEDGEQITAGRVYIAPGDYHMLVERQGAGACIRLDKGPPENFCRPAVDPMFRAIAGTYGGRALGVVLTGMGHDGLRGSRDLISAGGTVLAQDEASSVVWGMPGAVATAGLCSNVLPLSQLGNAVERFIMGAVQ